MAINHVKPDEEKYAIAYAELSPLLQYLHAVNLKSSSKCYNSFAMPGFTTEHVFILPHAEEYRVLYNTPLDEVLKTLNESDTKEGLSTGRYTAEKGFAKHQV